MPWYPYEMPCLESVAAQPVALDEDDQDNSFGHKAF